MKKSDIEEAVFEATRFLGRAKTWLERAKKDDMIEYGSAEGGALRRSSLDLSRSLAQMRKY